MTRSRGTVEVLRTALRIVPEFRRGLVLTIVMATVGTGFQLVVPIVVQRIVDTQLLGDGSIDIGAVLAQGAVALAFLVAAVAVRAGALVRMVTRAARGLSDLRVMTFAHLHRLSALYVQSERRGALVARVTSDVETIQQFVQWGGVGLVIGIAQVVLAIAAMAVYRWQLAVLMTIGVVIYTLLLVWFQRILRRAHDRVRTTVAASLGTMGESISGLSIVRAHGAEDATLDKVSEALDDQFRAEFRTGLLGASLFSSAELFAGLITAVAIGVGIVAGDGWGMTAGTLLAFLFLINLLVEPVQTLVETLDRAQSAAAGLARILTVLDEPVDIADPGDAGVALPAGVLDVRFRGVRFRYPTGGDVLRDIDVHIPPGRKIAVVGETGSGKSTFTKLVTRLLDATEGVVEVGGVDVRRVQFDSLRSRLAFVPQEGFLFDSTIAENVRYGRPKASDADVIDAFADMGLADWIDSMPNGIYTYVGERGNRLSAGERQLVALVRAWIAAPDLLVLDEATSAVDPALEVRLRRAIERLTEGRTSITVAHRLSTAEASDGILVFDRGLLVEEGHHDELLAQGGVYAALQADWAAGTQGPGQAPAPVG